ncbi:1-propanol dehydrogenase PduQ [Paramaledivibacter caminithermalis]|jgi:acetaldehyde dehydrogenase/alcohol dehydrogenase|uniref:Alcohol dehydrogenase, class IV n=1 Tax=Paramaledivibacter caminithermalis (strain DSM 15212 / CIP 107654 / DViRD3) TaxID=1121301 RepID=A0A1M6PN04_PARC5|nr:1-propanol dehydrogenase PduQ [Paramaledivibacter caminithermalis]SHK09293.1 Alcohol dehydrogenase, class IV [Paramaledivibacter caminithermalis DSM 15212]
MNRFQIKTQVYSGCNSTTYLESIDAERACIVTDKLMVELGIVDKIIEVLRKNKIEHKIFDEVQSDPSLETVTRGLHHIIKTKPDLLIAVGGGSAIDAAKAIMFFCIKTKEELVDKKAIKKPWFVAIPTTSGTGSEVTTYSVITDKNRNIKIPISDELMVPDVAILDPQFTKTVPPSVTADTGMDVLTHSIEALVSKGASEYTDMFAQKSIELVFKYLLRAFKDGKDMTARGKMHDASCMAGIAFTNAGLGITHSLAHAVGAKYNLSHGRANAILLPYVIEYNSGIKDNHIYRSNIGDRYRFISRLLGLPSSTIEEGVIALIEAIKTINKILNIPITFKALGIDRNKFEKNLNNIAENAINDMCTMSNPKEVNKEDMINILERAYFGI